MLFALLIAFAVSLFASMLGAAVVFFRKVKAGFFRAIMALSCGIMLVASFFELLLPSIEATEGELILAILVPIAFLLGATVILCLGVLLKKASEKPKFSSIANVNSNKGTTLVLAMCLHNIPEGLAIGVLLGSVIAVGGGMLSILTATIALGLHNVFEGAIVAITNEGSSKNRLKAFFVGIISGAVEFFAAIIGLLFVFSTVFFMPIALSLAAGAMLAVIFHEVIFECRSYPLGKEKPTKKGKQQAEYLCSLFISIGITLSIVMYLTVG